MIDCFYFFFGSIPVATSANMLDSEHITIFHLKFEYAVLTNYNRYTKQVQTCISEYITKLHLLLVQQLIEFHLS